jgi:hypothetical protein
VHIKERLEIKSQQAPVRSLQGVEEMTPATLEIIWDAPDDVVSYAVTPCGGGQLSESSPGRKVYTFPGSVAGGYFFRIFYYACNVFGQPAAPPANITGTLRVGSETPIVFHGTVQPRYYCMGAPNYFEFTYVRSTPYVSLSHLYLRPDDGFITDGWGTGFWYEANEGCVSTRWYPESDPITLTIVSGSEFGKFVVGDDPALVTTVTLLVSELPTVRFIPSGRYAPDGEVTIEARCLSLVSGCLLRVKYCSILLGETKYFYAVQEGGCETYPKLKIYEADSPVLPPGAEATDVWVVPDRGNGTSPVKNSGYEENSGSRLGVYWEKNKPIPGGAGNLPVGMIRLVGRYWHPDSVYTVDLNATKKAVCWGREGIFGDWVPIEVKKPDVLGNPGIADQARHSIVKDVTNNDLHLDALIIKYAGENGLPPQIIKGQIEEETSFRPAWRYEPFRDLEWQRGKYQAYFASDLPFNVREGVPNDLPPAHTNASPTRYVQNPAKIGDFTVQYWFDRYVRRGVDDQPDVILGSKRLTKLWYWVYWSTLLSSEQSGIPVGVSELKSYAHDFVKARILDGSYDKDFNRIAQTRKVTSYGYVQMMYTTAVDYSWRETEARYGTIGRAYVDKRDPAQYPEKLNEQEFLFPRYSDFTLFDLRVAITEAVAGRKLRPKDLPSTKLVEKLPDANWPTGFENVWARTIQWHNYYSEGYGQAVILNAENFHPAKK